MPLPFYSYDSCHPRWNREHLDLPCHEPCPRTCERGHACTAPCMVKPCPRYVEAHAVGMAPGPNGEPYAIQANSRTQ